MNIMLKNSKELAERAFSEFARIARAEKRDLAYNIAYRRLVPQFSTAPTAETVKDISLIEDMAKLGHGEAAVIVGEELRNWAQHRGYHHG